MAYKSVLFYCIALTTLDLDLDLYIRVLWRCVLLGDGNGVCADGDSMNQTAAVACRQNGCGVGYAQLGSLCSEHRFKPMLGILHVSLCTRWWWSVLA